MDKEHNFTEPAITLSPLVNDLLPTVGITINEKGKPISLREEKKDHTACVLYTEHIIIPTVIG